ncbi:MAG: DUF4349 domain-containing protein [Butyrivibrio sp.]|uniref:DUF4349 domain-containing protein n=1 Tax=Butyrivibrio sp. TaxID=28121 RepID=UPI0025EEB77E|nr:DUF4349 domain-containing protein [Butyrivibrio sp.]MCR5772592.1 DUF4349 domain-containing protein [Butyrivibrio sp.]
MKKFRTGFNAAAALALALIVTGCGGSSKESTSYTYEEAIESDVSMGAEYDSMEVADSNGTDSQTTVEVDESSQVSDRKLITTSRISAETINFEDTITWVESKTAELGGYVESSSISVSGGYYYNEKYRDLHYADYTIRIPEDKLDSFLEDVDSITNITSQNKNVEDVTLTYTDMVARQEALESEKEALQRLMDSAENMEDIITIQSQLTDVQYQIDSIKSQLRVYDNKIDYSTIYLTLREVEPDDLTVTEQKSAFERIKDGFTTSLKSTGEFIVEFIIAVIINLPQIILLVVIIVIIVKLVKHNKKSKAKKQERLYNSKVNTNAGVKTEDPVNVNAGVKTDDPVNTNAGVKTDDPVNISTAANDQGKSKEDING